MRRNDMLKAVMCVVGVVGLGLVSGPVWAGSIGDFKDSVDEKRSSGSDDDGGGDDYDSTGEAGIGSDCYEWAENPENCANYSHGSGTEETDIGYSWLLGARPGWELSLGTAPYRGRYDGTVDAILDSDRPGYASTGYALEMSGDFRLNQFTARASGLATTQLDGGGLEVFVKHTSTRTPGFALKYTRMHEFDSRERLGFLRPTYEPNLIINNVMTMSLNLGWSMMLDRRGIFAHGPSTGLGLELFPGDPWLIEARGGVDVVSGVVMPHVRGALGIFATDRLAIEANAQHMQVSGGAGLSTLGLGIRFYQGW